MLLDDISEPGDLRRLTFDQLDELAGELRDLIVRTVTTTGGHLGSNLGAVELTLALHRVFDSPRDVILWDTGHQAYVHKLVTGRRGRFDQLRQPGGISGYPSRAESPHDWIENSHASTALSYAHGMAAALRLRGELDRRVVAVVGDGSLTGGMAYEALNNLGHSGSRVIIVLNDNGRSYAPTISKLSAQLAQLRLNPSYVQARERVRELLRGIPGLGGMAYSSVHGLTSALREVVTPHQFFEALGIRYAGPFDGHDIATMEHALANAAEWDGPILVHLLTHKGRGYAPAEEDDVQRLHDLRVQPKALGDHDASSVAPISYTDAFTRAVLDEAARRPDLVAITAAMPGPTGLLAFQSAYPDRFFDVGIAEQHAVTAAAGMAMAGLRPVVAVYSTFFSRAFDQANLDVGLHRLPVVFVLDRAGITGDDGPSHHGVLDLALALAIPGLTVFAPSSAGEVGVMLSEALALPGPSLIRFPKTPARVVADDEVGSGLAARLVHRGEGSVCLLAVGKTLQAAEEAAAKLVAEGVDATVWDVRVVSPPDLRMLADAARHDLVVTVEDGLRVGGAGSHLVAAMSALDDLPCPVPPVRQMGVPRRYLAQGKPDQILADLGLDAAGIAQAVLGALAVERDRAGTV
ncbi:MAG: 1-deoxy-D-xylulose-5-phosphate synthase [Actinomycetota bacterium]|jgi:1-deoxy-D-xylulose-5-phosphate synthase|nr:1-deoxy-D-xylulose-5-phosphate synthase [Actinomycetota bacterium]